VSQMALSRGSLPHYLMDCKLINSEKTGFTKKGLFKYINMPFWGVKQIYSYYIKKKKIITEEKIMTLIDQLQLETISTTKNFLHWKIVSIRQNKWNEFLKFKINIHNQITRFTVRIPHYNFWNKSSVVMWVSCLFT